MKRYAITRQETLEGYMFRIRTEAETNRYMNNTEKRVTWLYSDLPKAEIVRRFKEQLNKSVIGFEAIKGVAFK